MRRAFVVIVAVAFAAMAAGAASAGAKRARSSYPTIDVLSGRAELIAGGQALVAINLPRGTKRRHVKIYENRRNIRRRFAMRKDGRFEGLVTNLKLGKNKLTVVLPNGKGAQLILTNHPLGGPVFTGPQLQPWKCEPGARDAKCDKPPTYTYVYESTDKSKSGLQPYDPKNPPNDVATTTTENGQTVPFIVRVETGYEDRDQYKVAILFQPNKPWSWSDPQKQFNHKLLITHGASCDVDYETGSAPSVTSYNPVDDLGAGISFPQNASPVADSAVYALGKGFVLMSTALDNNGHDCDVVNQAESLVIAKQHVITSYGTLRYTIGTGCSGGSLAQQWIANAYPGIYQGILPTCSFPDTWSSATQVMDYHLLRAYFENSSHWGPGIVWSPSQWAPVEGNQLPLDAIVSDIGFFDAIVPTHSCGGISDAQRYDPKTNPGGVRCSVADMAINVFGPRPPSDWSANERKLGHGFAGVPVDNVGVQYGLSALNGLQITPDQFIDLNAKIGGLDIDINPTAARITATRPALANAYRSGMINETNNLGQTPIIDCRGPDPGAAHDSYRAFAIRARLDRENGTHANQLIWEGPAPIIGDGQCLEQSLTAMDRWVAAITSDRSSKSLPQKVIKDKPSDLNDACFNGEGVKVSSGQCPPGVVPVYGTPRTVAGDGITTDANKCQLKPLNPADYKIPFTASQWAQLKAIFPNGVCDFSRPGVDQQPTISWQTYQDDNNGGSVVYGGKPLGQPPASH